MMPVLDQRDLLVLSLYSVIWGLVLGAIYGVFRFFRIIRRYNGKNITARIIFNFFPCFFDDILFSLISTISMLLLFSIYSGGTVRILSLLCISVGFIVWHNTAGAITRVLAIKLKKVLSKLIKKLQNKYFPVIKAKINTAPKKHRRKEQPQNKQITEEKPKARQIKIKKA